MLVYPEDLPTPQREGYGFDPVSPMTSTKLVTGRSIHPAPRLRQHTDRGAGYLVVYSG